MFSYSHSSSGHSPNVTPFIPPLRSPEEGNSPVRTPVVPPEQGGLPPWASQQQTSANYPMFYPGAGPAAGSSSTFGTPFVPPANGFGTPSSGHIPTPGSYFPAPQQLPPQTPYHPSTSLDSRGFSSDYTGYPAGGGGGGGGATNSGTPWAGSASIAFPNTPRTQPVMPGHIPQTGYNNFQQQLPPFGGPPPLAQAGGYIPAGVYQPQPYPPYPAWQSMGMGPTSAPGGVPPWPGSTPWPAPQMPLPGAFGGGGGGGQPHGFGQQIRRSLSHGAADIRRFASRSRRNEEDLSQEVQFAVGRDYGPVLDSMLLARIKAHISINPLLRQPESDLRRPYLLWNMLFSSQNCRRSTDQHRSWMEGRDEPATHPRVTSIRVVIKGLPWVITIRAENRSVGVTCGNVIDQISDNLSRPVPKEGMPPAGSLAYRAIIRSYHYNRAPNDGVPGGRMGPGVLRKDWLLHKTSFAGLEDNGLEVERVCGSRHMPCTFELVCETPDGRADAEIERNRAQEALEEEEARLRGRRSRPRSGMARPTSGMSRPRSSSTRSTEPISIG